MSIVLKVTSPCLAEPPGEVVVAVEEDAGGVDPAGPLGDVPRPFALGNGAKAIAAVMARRMAFLAGAAS